MSISIRIEPELIARLEYLAERTGRSKSFYIREAIETHLDDLEDIYLAEHEMEAMRSGRSGRIALDEVIAEFKTSM